MGAIYKVYKITHRPTGRAYVGVTKTAMTTRIYHHVKAETFVGRAIAYYGKEQFDVEVLHRTRVRQKALDLEQEAIEVHNTHVPHGFNRHMRGGKYPGRGGPKKGNTNSRRRPVVALDADLKQVQHYETVMDAAKALGIQRNTIHRAILNPHYTAGGFHWRDAGTSPAPHGG